MLKKSEFIKRFGGINDSKLYTYQPLGEIANVSSGGTPNRDVVDYWTEGNIRWVKTTELLNCEISETEEHITEAGLINSSAKLMPANTILVAMYGQGKTRGMTGFLTNECATNQACACITVTDRINARFLWRFLALSYNYLRSMSKGANQLNLSASILKEFPVLMIPLDEQNRFSGFVCAIDKCKFDELICLCK